jgi:hypothetical protein
LAPDHPPEAAHELASLDDQVSVVEPPLVTDDGFAVRLSVGALGEGELPPPP